MDLQISVEDALSLAEQAFGEGDLRRAKQYYDHVLATAPGYPLALRGLALVAEAAGDLTAAVRFVEATIAAIDPSVRHAIRVDLARLQQKQGHHDLAAQTLMEAAEVFRQAHRLEEAAACLRQVLQLQPDHGMARSYLAANLCNQADIAFSSDGDAARRLIEEAVDLAPDSEVILRVLVKIYAYHGPEEKRLDALNRLVAVFDEQAPPAPPPCGLREVHPATATAVDIANALLSDGAVLVRGLLDAAGQEHFLSQTDQRWLRDEGLIFAHIPPVIVDAMALIFGRPPQGMISASNVRTARVDDDQSYLFYHQDLTPLCITGINLWAALDPIDGTRPGLEVLVRRQHRAFPVVAGHIIDSSPYRIPDDAVQGVFPASDFVAPKMAVGDGMLFLFTTVHRSHLRPEMTHSRRNAELRFI